MTMTDCRDCKNYVRTFGPDKSNHCRETGFTITDPTEDYDPTMGMPGFIWPLTRRVQKSDIRKTPTAEYEMSGKNFQVFLIQGCEG
jgi:hypothetical protein